MKVSIITVVYNNEKFIESAINSVLSQSYQDIEYIVIDGGSTDGTGNIIKKYENKISRYISEKDRGIYDGMNKGIGLSTGDIIGFLNSDDLYENNKTIEEIARIFSNEDNIQACYGDLLYLTPDLKKIVRYWKAGEYSRGSFKKGWVPPHPTFFVKRDILKKYGSFNLDFSISADFELLLRLMEKHSIKVKYIPKVIVKMRWGGESNRSIKNILKANREKYNSFKGNNIKVNLSFYFYNFLFKTRQLKSFSYNN